jgi:hypothetical protein
VGASLAFCAGVLLGLFSNFHDATKNDM